MIDAPADPVRLRAFWDERYREFSLSESGWRGAGEPLNQRLYAAKVRALRGALGRAGHDAGALSVLDAGCGQGFFARVYRDLYPDAVYVGVDISPRAIDHLRSTVPGEFHLGDLCDWTDPYGRRFDIVQAIDVLSLILDDDAGARAIGNLANHRTSGGRLLVTAALPDSIVQPSHYLRYRSR